MATRKVVQYPGRSGHHNPIPICVTLGDLILPSVVSGSGSEPRAAIESAFKNLREVIAGAGGSLDGVGKVTVYLKSLDLRELVNEQWLKTFPNEDNRPARHVLVADLGGDTLIQMDVIASL